MYLGFSKVKPAEGLMHVKHVPSLVEVVGGESSRDTLWPVLISSIPRVGVSVLYENQSALNRTARDPVPKRGS